MYSSSGERGSGSSLHSGELWLCSALVLFWEALLAVAPERIPRSTRAFLAPRPFSAVAATTAAMFRSHPPSLSSPSGIVVCVRGLPRAFRPAYRSETTFPRSQRSGPGRTTPPRRPRRRARSLVSLQLGAESCREELGSPATPRPGHPSSALSLAAQSVSLRRYWLGCRRSFGRESPTPTSSREEGLEFRVVAQS